MTRDQSRQGWILRSIAPVALGTTAVTTALIATPVAASGKCPTALNQMAVVMKVQTDMLAALENEDGPGWERLATRDFVVPPHEMQHLTQGTPRASR